MVILACSRDDWYACSHREVAALSDAAGANENSWFHQLVAGLLGSNAAFVHLLQRDLFWLLPTDASVGALWGPPQDWNQQPTSLYPPSYMQIICGSKRTQCFVTFVWNPHELGLSPDGGILHLFWLYLCKSYTLLKKVQKILLYYF